MDLDSFLNVLGECSTLVASDLTEVLIDLWNTKVT